MYDFASEASIRGVKLLKPLEINTVPEFSDLSTPEVSFDLHNFIETSSNQTPAEEALFGDILIDESGKFTKFHNIPAVPYVVTPMPQSGGSGFGSDRYGSEASGVKQEPAAGIETRVSGTAFGTGRGTATYAFAGLPVHLSDSAHSPGYGEQSSDLGSSRSDDKSKSKKSIDKASDEYRRRRERNNIAVRKSREKAKQRCKDTERRVCDLVSENDKLRKRVELLSKELSVLKNLLSAVGVPPESGIHKMD